MKYRFHLEYDETNRAFTCFITVLNGRTNECQIIYRRGAAGHPVTFYLRYRFCLSKNQRLTMEPIIELQPDAT